MTARVLALLVAFWRGLLTTLDSLWPGWSRRPVPARNAFGDPLSSESLNYWLHAERVRRTRD